MGLITGVSLTVLVVYVYCVSAWRLVQVKKEFDKESKVGILILLFDNRMKTIHCTN